MSVTKSKPKLRALNLDAFYEGRQAFNLGQPASVCPYTSRNTGPANETDQRLDWMNGYYQAKYGDKWGV
jgi:ribosome modulation factor